VEIAASTSFGKVIVDRPGAQCASGLSECAPPSLETKDEFFDALYRLMSGLNILV